MPAKDGDTTPVPEATQHNIPGVLGTKTCLHQTGHFPLSLLTRSHSLASILILHTIGNNNKIIPSQLSPLKSAQTPPLSLLMPKLLVFSKHPVFWSPWQEFPTVMSLLSHFPSFSIHSALQLQIFNWLRWELNSLSLPVTPLLQTS